MKRNFCFVLALGFLLFSFVVRPQRFAAFAAHAETEFNQFLDRNHGFIEAFGLVQRLTGRRVIEDVEARYTVLLRLDGGLDFLGSPSDLVQARENAANVNAFSARLLAEQIPFLFLQAPHKSNPNQPQNPYGIETGNHAAVDTFLDALDKKTPYLDFRPGFEAAPEGAPPYFFRTDHHWTPEGAFFAFQSLCRMLYETYQFEIPKELSDPLQYQITNYPNRFLGSQGKRVGVSFAGLDDISLWEPRFETHFTNQIPIHALTKEGSFRDALLFPERLSEGDFFSENPYTLYSGGDYPLTRIINHQNPDGPRAVLLRDSFGCAFAPFLATVCAELVTIDPRLFGGDLLAQIKKEAPDLVLMLCTTGSVQNQAMFQSLK